MCRKTGPPGCRTCRIQAQFLTDVAQRHPDAEGKPVLVGNCQAGWSLGTEPELARRGALKP
jgi:hypothetical protein